MKIIGAGSLIVLGAVAPEVIESHTVNIQTIGAVAVIVIPAVWWLGKKFQSIEDDIKSLKSDVQSLKVPGDKK